MSKTLDILTYRLTITAEINGKPITNINNFSSTFAINTIPSASLTLATGREVQTLATTPFHDIGLDSDKPLPAKVWVTYSDLAGATYKVLVFEGETAGVGWARTANRASFIIHLKHWLSHLNYASALSSAIHPGNPGNLTYPAVEQVFQINADTGEAGSDRQGWIHSITTDGLDTAIEKDMWDELLLPYLKEVVAQDPFDSQLEEVPVNTEANAKILDALKRMTRSEIVTAGYDGGAPLALNLIDAQTELPRGDTDQLLGGIGTELSDRSSQSFAYTTIWGKLIGEYGPTFLFEIVPTVSHALVVPISGALRKDPWMVLSGDDQLQIELSGEMEQPLRAIAIMHPLEDVTNINNGGQVTPLSVGGSFGMYQGSNTGAILFKTAPGWLTAGMSGYRGDAEGQGVGEGADTVVTSADELEPQANNSDNVEKFADGRKKNAMLAQAYAQQLYISEILKSRIGSVTGPFRQDIAPGSTIKILAPEDLLPEIRQDERTDFLAKVIQVTSVIDAQDASAATTFTLTHCRTTVENKSDNYSSPAPALYKAGWVGGELSKAERVN